MKTICPKSPRVRLDPKAYAELHRLVLMRDNWRCQNCGSLQSLHVHHQEFRSHSASDVKENLITLCADCHAQVHRIRFSP